MFFSGGLSLCLSTVGTGQNIRMPCTALNLRLPNYTVGGKTPLSFSMDIAGAKEVLGSEKARQLVFNWRFSEGTIVTGQGTPSITLDIGKLPSAVRNILVSVDVKGIPPYCETGLSRSIRINPECASPSTFDTYCDLPLRAEQSRLDALANALKVDSHSVCYILTYAGQNACIWEAEWRATRAKKYLVEKHEIDSDRVIIMDGGFRQNFTTELFISPRNACGPLPSPTLGTDDAQIRGQCSDKYSNRNETRN